MSMSKKFNIDNIDAVLPQTQCGLCEYDGCKPYAEAIALQGERIDKCLPGGVATLIELGKITAIDTSLMQTSMSQKAKAASIVKIREDECIGCTKCIQACPVDAIIGASKQMHTILSDICNGCELCLPPCPVDCIDIINTPEPDAATKQSNANLWRERYQQRNERLAHEQQQRLQKHEQAKLGHGNSQSIADRKAAIAAAVTRRKQKSVEQD